jgi:drug/metabolite transporter (DMT)-like permease
MERLGELAAFGTAICWTVSAIFFEGATRRIGALAVNLYKVLGAFLLLGLAGFAMRGVAFPFDAPLRAWIYLPISGIIGFVIADYFLFNAYILIGSRITVIFQALTPLFTTLFGFLILGERPRPEGAIAMVVVIVGIGLVVGTRAQSKPGASPQTFSTKGIVFAFFSSVFQALGLIFSKLGLGGYDVVSGTQIRVLVAFLGFAIQAILVGQARKTFVSIRDPFSFRNTAIGAFFGPFVGVALSLFALQHANAGAASTLMALTPVLIIPPSIILLKQRVRPLEVVGAAVAVTGAALFFLL